MTFLDKIMYLLAAGMLIWGIIIISEQAQEIIILKTEIATHWYLQKVYNKRESAWADYQKALGEGKKATWNVTKRRFER